MTAQLPPVSVESEQCTLGAVLADNGAFARIADRRLTASAFFDARHVAIWSAIETLIARREPADVITVFTQLQSQGLAEDCGGLVYLNALAQTVPSSHHIARYADTVAARALDRRLLGVASDIREIAMDAEGSAAEKLDRAAALIAGVQRVGSRYEPRSFASLFVERHQHWQDLESGAATAGFATGLPTIDRAFGGGLPRGALLIIAARPSIGKTSLALQVLLNVASSGEPVLALSQEMPAAALIDRMAANLGRVNLGAIASGQFEDDDWSRLCEATEAAARLPIHIDDEHGLTLAAVCAKARIHKQKFGLSVLVVDYLQLMTGTNPRDNRNQQLEQISRGLKTLAKELEICVIALSQLNRQSVQRSEPDLSDLRDSGAIEQDADAVVILHPKGNLADGAMLIAGIFAKNRQGRRGRVALAFHGATQRWVESTADVSPTARGEGGAS